MSATFKKNSTGLKTLNKLERDPRVKEIWSEGEDGLWLSLNPGWNWEGCSCCHEHTAKELLAALDFVSEGAPY